MCSRSLPTLDCEDYFPPLNSQGRRPRPLLRASCLPTVTACAQCQVTQLCLLSSQSTAWSSFQDGEHGCGGRRAGARLTWGRGAVWEEHGRPEVRTER